jgi:transcription termination factor NusB/archaellum component FlaC
MSSHGKSIGRIQSAPPDEGEPDLKSTLNLHAQEFNPFAVPNKPPASQMKVLSAQANDFVPDFSKSMNSAPSPGYPSFQPSRGPSKKPYGYQQSYSHYSSQYQFGYPNHGHTNPYGPLPTYHNASHTQGIQSPLPAASIVPLINNGLISSNSPIVSNLTASAKDFTFNAETPSFEMNFSTGVQNIQPFEIKTESLSLDTTGKNSEDNCRDLVQEKEVPEEKIKQENGKIDENLGKIEEKLGKIEEKLGNIDENIGKIDESIGNIDENIGKIDESLGKIDENLGKQVKLEEILSGMEKSIQELKEDDQKKTLEEEKTLKNPQNPEEKPETEKPETFPTPDLDSTPVTPALFSPKSPERLTGPKRRIYDLETIKTFKLDFQKDPNFLLVPDSISKFCNRVVEETRAPKRGGKNQDDKKITREVTQKLIWRKAKTLEEQKISEKAKAYTRKFTATVVEQEKLKKEIKSTLNKLSPNNLAKLTQNILETCKKSHDCLKLVVSGIFEKAWSEKKYTQMYSDICKTLKSGLEGYRYPDIDPAKLPETRNYFKYELLYMCEETFNKNHQEEIPASLTEEQRIDRLKKLKDKTLGNVRFIGELFNVNLITAKIVLECVTGLIDLFESENNQDRLEGACLLLQTGGTSFERSKLLQETNKVYDRLTQISSKEISSKNRFKIMDLKEFRDSGWKNLPKEGLKKVEEIHADHLMEQEEIKRRHGYNN